MIKIGTNFNYKAPFYLDGRQYAEVPQGMMYYDVLRNWDIPIPDGFEVFCGGKWWTYGVNNHITVTGKFRQRTGGGEETPHFSITLSHPTGSELYVPYNQTLSRITVGWVTKYGADAVAPQTLTILLGGRTYTPPNPDSSGTYEITGVNIQGGNQLKVTAGFGGESDTKTVTFVKTYTKYWGALANPTIDYSDLLNLTEISNATSATLTKTYDCTGGKYPYYIMSKPLYESVKDTLKMYVDGWENTAYSVTELVSNGETFSVIRHDIPQTGVMEIKFTV